MSSIIWNNIKKEIKLLHPASKVQQIALTRTIERAVYPDREKTWTRILNNSSQPTLDELSTIATHLGKPMDDLVELSTLCPLELHEENFPLSSEERGSGGEEL